MFRITIFFLLVFSFNQLYSEEINIFEVILPKDDTSELLYEFHIAKRYSDILKMDSLMPSILAFEKLSPKQEAVKHYMLGWYFIYIDFFDKASESFLKSIRLGDKLKLRRLVLQCRSGMAVVEYGNKNLDVAIADFKAVLKDTKEEDWELVANLHANIAPLTIEQNLNLVRGTEKEGTLKDSSYKIVKEHYKIAIELLEKNNGWLSLSRVYALYGSLLRTNKELAEAEKYLRKALEVSLKINNNYRYHFNLIMWSQYFIDLQQYGQARDSSYKALKYFKKVGNKDMEAFAMASLAHNYAFVNQFDSAYHFMKKIKDLRGSMNVERMARQSKQYKIELEVFDKENKIQEQARKIEVQEYENQLVKATQKRWLIGGSSLLVIILLISFIYIQFTKQKTKTEKAQLIIKEREQAFRSVIEGQEAERKRIAQELHDGIGQQLSGIKMALQNVVEKVKEHKETSYEQLESVIGLVGASSSEVRHLAHQMLPQVLEKKGLAEALKDLIQSIYQTTGIKFNYDNQISSIQLEHNWELTIYRSIQELINNTIKHADAKEIDIYLYESKSNLLVAYSDNGKGMKEAELNSGLGLTGIKHRVENLQGRFVIEQSVEQGFNAIIKVPRT